MTDLALPSATSGPHESMLISGHSTQVSHGWHGCFDGFEIGPTHHISLDSKKAGLPSSTALSSKDVWRRGFYYLETTFAITVPQHLDKEHFLEAASLVLKSYPALGSRLQLQPLPASLSFSEVTYPVSFAEWPHGSASQFHRDYQWKGSSENQSFLPAAPFSHDMEVEKALKGQAPLFTLRLTSLGDGTSVIAANWIHILADGKRIGDVLNALAAAYRTLDGKSSSISAFLPQANVERKCWPWHVRGLMPDAHEKQEAEEDKMQVMCSQEGLLEGPACIIDKGNFAALLGVFAVQKDEGSPGWHATITVQLQKSDVLRLKAALQTHPLLAGIAFSTNDVVLGVSWMLQCDAKGRSRPGQGAAGSSRGASIVVDASIPWPELAPQGFLGNLLLDAMVVVVSSGSRDDDTANSLHSALAQTVAAIRTSIIDARKPAHMEEALTTTAESFMPSANLLAAQSYLRKSGVEMLLTNWNHAGHESMDFGKGPPTSLNGHFGLQRVNMIGVFDLCPDAFGIRIPLDGLQALHRLKESSVLPVLAPQSGLLGGIE